MKLGFPYFIAWMASTLGARFEDYVNQSIDAIKITIKPELVRHANKNAPNDGQSLNIPNTHNIMLASEQRKVFFWNNNVILFLHNFKERSSQWFTILDDHVQLYFTDDRLIVTLSTFNLRDHQIRKILDIGFKSMSDEFPKEVLNGLVFLYEPSKGLILSDHLISAGVPLTVESLESGKFLITLGSNFNVLDFYFSMTIEPNLREAINITNVV